MHNTIPTVNEDDSRRYLAQLAILKTIVPGNHQPSHHATILPDLLIALTADATILYEISLDQSTLHPVASVGVALPEAPLSVAQYDDLACVMLERKIQAFDCCNGHKVPFLNDGMQHGVVVPITLESQRPGILCITRKNNTAFSKDDIAFLEVVKVVYNAEPLLPQPEQQPPTLEAIIQSVTDAVLITDKQGMIYSANRPARMLLNLHSKKLMARQIDDIPIQPKIRNRLHQAMYHLNAAITIFDLSLDDGRVFSALLTRLPQSTDRLSEGWALILRDVSHIRQLEKAQVRAIRDAIHDLKNPLGVTMGAVVMLEDIIPHDKLTDELLDLSIESLKNMERLIDNLLNIQRIQHRENPPMMLVDVEPALWRAIQSSQEALTQKQQVCHLDICRPLPPIMAMEAWFVRAVHSYLNIASKASPAKSSIHLTACIRGTELCIEVRDSGDGIDPTVTGENWSDIYRHLAIQVEETSNKDMMFVKSVAEAHGGSVYMFSKPGEGSTHGISLPLTTKEP